MDLRNTLSQLGELAAWQTVPELVKTRYKEAADIQKSIRKVMSKLPPLMPGYGYVYWNPEEKTAWIVCGDSDTEQDIQKWHNALKAIPGVMNVKSEAEYGPYNDPDWIRIKRASALSWVNAPYQLAGRMTGGPSPMSNALVSGLLGAGAGYLGGTLLEHVLPREYVDEGKLRGTLAMLGGGAGAAMHIPQAFANAGINQKATGAPHWLRSIFGGNQYQQMSPHEMDWRNNYLGGQKQAAWQCMRAVTSHLPDPPTEILAAAFEFVKTASIDSGLMGSNGVQLKPVAVDAFNNAIWNDVHNGMNSSQANPYGTRSHYSDNSDDFHTPPANAAAACGLVSGIQQMYGNPPTLSPVHFIRGLASAGVDLATAHVAGGVLGALGGLSPAAQRQLQQMGVWSGMIRGVTGSVLGLR